MADKGFTGASGATASAGTGVWYVQDDPELREAAMARREKVGAGLTDRAWMSRVLDDTIVRMDELARIQRYPFPVDGRGRQIREDLQGPEYMRRQRIRLQRLGVRILDHTPALGLLTDGDGVVSGATAVRRADGLPLRITAGAVVLATGGCAFQSKTMGCDTNTGDGALMAAEAGAALSGMEFSCAYALAPKNTSMTKNAYYAWATFYRSEGTFLEAPGATKDRTLIAETLLNEPVYARLDLAPESDRATMRTGQPNFFLTFDRLGIDPFTEMFEITLLCEGTVRGTGGVRIAEIDCATDVPGLYAAGDAATRQLIAGAYTGGGAHNASWAACSGAWAGRGAAQFARARGGPPTHTSDAGGAGAVSVEALPEIQRLCTAYDINYLRHAERLKPALAELDALWGAARGGSGLRAREATAMLAHGRWMYHAALHRQESRGMHQRADFPAGDSAQQHRLVTGGLDELWTVPEPQWLADGKRAA
ncbi:succinate dehydrogenase/fumarate reductase flavoprotein subunit [Mycolicibacterium iranicum]|uniref:Succinate dehydrogenase/fumarate reductase flavoprotein subunit n=1 Tax=Mycolicibacterium iranicum TaxID=912594 RepID=A0A839Q1P3_MYCIR|nr:succinate dehydrogenase/fumarate reductase flavoprotein subunit [Mycolicibacterium iranicum]